MTIFARISEICWLSFEIFSQRFGVRYKKRSPTLPQVLLFTILSGAVPSVVGEGHMSASNRHKDGEQDPVKWEEDEGGSQKPPKSRSSINECYNPDGYSTLLHTISSYVVYGVAKYSLNN